MSRALTYAVELGEEIISTGDSEDGGVKAEIDEEVEEVEQVEGVEVEAGKIPDPVDIQVSLPLGYK
jgi:hypothetical protein